MKNSIVIWYFTTNPISSKVLVLELLALMLLANQIAGFFKILHGRREWWSLFLASGETSKFFASCFYHFGCV